MIKLFLILLICFFQTSCKSEAFLITAPLKLNAEDLTIDGKRLTPITQSFLRGAHKLESAEEIVIDTGRTGDIRLSLTSKDNSIKVSFESLDLEQLVPRLNYRLKSPPDSFDAFNLMLAEYSRNGVSVPQGTPSDLFAHFEAVGTGGAPWSLSGDYKFEANSIFQPLRLGIVNNCLDSGKWEVFAEDSAGEFFHGWFDFPLEIYFNFAASTNDLPVEFVKKALTWSETPTPLILDRLRELIKNIGTTPVKVLDAPIGYSNQSSRKKIQQGFVQRKTDKSWTAPKTLLDVSSSKIRVPSFVSPGKYSAKEHREFDFGYLRTVKNATIRTVKPKTAYPALRTYFFDSETEANHIEIELHLQNRNIIIGNLPIALLVEQEDFAIHGFGVGILPAEDFAERRKILLSSRLKPTYAYLLSGDQTAKLALNTHLEGLEQIYIRTKPFDDTPHWEITITSYERIVDLIRYKVEIPDELVEQSRDATIAYSSPLFFTYRDDNIR